MGFGMSWERGVTTGGEPWLSTFGGATGQGGWLNVKRGTKGAAKEREVWTSL